RARPSDRFFQRDERTPEGFLRADPAVLDRRFARTAHAVDRDSRTTGGGAFHRDPQRTIAGGRRERASRRGAALKSGEGPASALAVGIGPDSHEQGCAGSRPTGRRSGGSISDPGRSARSETIAYHGRPGLL